MHTHAVVNTIVMMLDCSVESAQTMSFSTQRTLHGGSVPDVDTLIGFRVATVDGGDVRELPESYTKRRKKHKAAYSLAA